MSHKFGMRIATAGLLAGMLSGCNVGGLSQPKTDQSKVCMPSNLASAKKNCSEGELMFYAPNSWGNEQLPLYVIAAMCDTNRPVQYNKSGVVCTYTSKRLAQIENSK